MVREREDTKEWKAASIRSSTEEEGEEGGSSYFLRVSTSCKQTFELITSSTFQTFSPQALLLLHCLIAST